MKKLLGEEPLVPRPGMNDVDPHPPRDSSESRHWRRNLAVCLFGSFTTVLAMTLITPFLPIYVKQLGVHGRASITQWSGIVFGATFLTAALTAPLWGRLGDRYGRKSMLVRASLGTTLAMSLIGLVHNIWQLLALRLLTGLLGGYSTGSTILVAAQTPKARTAWALGVLAVGYMAGNIAGPLLGGVAPDLIGIRRTFLAASGLIFVAFLATCFLLRESPSVTTSGSEGHASAPKPRVSGGERGQVAMLVMASGLLMFAVFSIEPILTLYVQQLLHSAEHVSSIAGVIFMVTPLGSMVSAPLFGRAADRLGHLRVVVGSLLTAGALLLAQAAVTNVYELLGLRFLLGIALGGLIPAITAAIRHRVPESAVGRILGYGISAQQIGQVSGPTLSGFVAGSLGPRQVFLVTGVVLFVAALTNYLFERARKSPDSSEPEMFHEAV